MILIIQDSREFLVLVRKILSQKGAGQYFQDMR